MTDPRISVIIPTYNRAGLVLRAVASARRAIAPGDEIIVVDDGSTDDTEQALAPLGDQIRYVRTDNHGAGPARNRGVQEARHPLIAFLDSDDEFMPDKLVLQRALMRAKPELVMSCTDFVAVDAKRERHNFLVKWHGDTRSWDDILGAGVPYSTIAPLPSGRDDFAVHVGDMYPVMLLECYVAMFTAVVRRDAVTDILAPGDLPCFEDWEYFAVLARRGPAAFLNCETARQWGHDGPRLTQAAQVQQSTARLTLLQRVWGTDDEFLTHHRGQYQRIVNAEHLNRARHLIEAGRTREARADLALAGRAPLSWRILSRLPGPVGRRLVRLRG